MASSQAFYLNSMKISCTSTIFRNKWNHQILHMQNCVYLSIQHIIEFPLWRHCSKHWIQNSVNQRKCVSVCVCACLLVYSATEGGGVGSGNELQINSPHSLPPRSPPSQRRVSKGQGLTSKLQEGLSKAVFLTLTFLTDSKLYYELFAFNIRIVF